MTSQLRTLLDSNLLVFGIFSYMYTCKLYTTEAKLEEYLGKIQVHDQPEFSQNLPCFADCSMKSLVRCNFFLLIWIALATSFHLIIVGRYVSRADFLILMVNHFLNTNPYKMSIFEISVTRSHELYSSFDKN